MSPVQEVHEVMQPEDKIYVAGHTGLVGSALVRRLRHAGYRNLLLCSHRELDLMDARVVRQFFVEHRPQYVFLAAAKVGGIGANQKFPAEFIFDNLKIQTNVIHECWQGGGVQRLIFLGSSCIYPKFAPQPVREEHWLTGPLEPTNRAYAVAKIAGVEMGWAYNRQHGPRFLAAMPTNLYGPGDHYDSQTSHLIPALIRKMHQAKISGASEVVLWGSGTPRREFLYSTDAADACIFLMNLPKESFECIAGSGETPPLINVGSGQDSTVREVAELVAKVVGVSPTLRFDATMPDGTPRKLLDVGLLSGLGWRPARALPDGLRETYADFCARLAEDSLSASSSEKPVTQCVS